MVMATIYRMCPFPHTLCQALYQPLLLKHCTQGLGRQPRVAVPLSYTPRPFHVLEMGTH